MLMVRGLIWFVLVGLMSLGCSSSVSVGVPGCENCPERCLQENNRGRCVTCLTDTHCQTSSSPSKKCTQDNRCVCGSDKDCPEGQLCAGANGCVECKSNSDCKNADRAICIANRCSKCEPKSIRACAPEGVDACVKGTQTCINGENWSTCKDWKRCGAGEKCEKGACVPDCPTPAACKENETTCTSQAGEVPGRLRECTKDARGCPVLKKEMRCKDTEVCDKGACIPYTCPAASCKLGDQRCEGTTHTQKCGKNKLGCVDWLPKEPCLSKQFCSPSSGQCVICEPSKEEACFRGDSKMIGVGECKAGKRICSSDGSAWGPCQGEVASVKEVCGDSKDNNCDGSVDEKCPCLYNNKNAGVCKSAQTDAKGQCQPPSGYNKNEQCGDSLDNNCDGNVDEGCVCNYQGKVQGVCKQGQRSQGQCKAPPTYSATEICGDKLDNNCDGSVDEGCPCGYLGKVKGECSKGTLNAQGICQKPGNYSAAEKCGDKLDNNCDGAVDEGCPCNYLNNNKGVCAKGKLNSLGNCLAPSSYNTKEQCNDNQDNNCNGAVDEGCGLALVIKTSINTSTGYIDGKPSTAWSSSTGVFKFASVTIPSGSTVKVSGSRPLVIESSGAVKIDGVLQASGQRGLNGAGGPPSSSGAGGAGGVGCCGGFAGGRGGNGYTGSGSSGLGPGGGKGGRARAVREFYNGGGGGGAGHATRGGTGYNGIPGAGGGTYGTTQLTTLQGGSGGGGGSGGKGGARYKYGGSGGGGGGGYVKVSSGVSITVGATGAVSADGGQGGRCQNTGAWAGGGAGSGGAIYLSAPTVTNQGKVTALGGVNCAINGANATHGRGGDGRIRVDTKGGVRPGGTFNPAIGFVGTK